MYRFSRAAASAAASLAVVLTAVATPSQAMNYASVPLAAHNLANLTADQQLPDPVEAPVAPEADFSSPPAKPLSLLELVDHHIGTARVTDGEIECLAGAIYFESKGEPLQGQLSVAEVVLNRARSGRFPASICGVVKQRGQFSVVRGGRLPAVRRDSAAWRKAVAVAHIARAELAEGAAPKALFFHARRVAPGWSRATRVATIGNHVFYR